ncbi:hypothetical protein V8D89_009240 [Ganoderma adspersum]
MSPTPRAAERIMDGWGEFIIGICGRLRVEGMAHRQFGGLAALGRNGQPEDVAKLVSSTVSDDAAFIIVL